MKKARRNIDKVCEALIDDCQKAGVSWKEIAPIDKIAAVRMVRDAYNCSLRLAMDTVTTFLAE
jgi:hypothetical protein